MFSEESTFTQFYSFSRHVRRPVGKRNDHKFRVSAVKQCAKVMVWGAFSGKGGQGGLLQHAQTIDAVYRGILEEKLSLFMQNHNVHHC